MEPLVSLVPSGTLVFNLERGTQPKTVLRITNTSNSKVVFKVKTTQPTWYYVRPNQQMLDIGQSEDVAILLVDTECNRFLDQAQTNTEEKLDKHRFLVQSKVIEDAEYNRILELPPTSRTDEFTRIWEGPKDDRKNIKLKVEFKYPDPRAASPTPARATATDNADAVRNRLSRGGDGNNSGGRQSVDNSSSSAAGGGGINNPEVVFTELQSLRKKYDAVVEYTVHLTAERDAIVAQLETSQRELVKEKSKKKQGGATAGGASEKDSAIAGKKSAADKGFSLFVVLFVALVCFLIGKYIM